MMLRIGLDSIESTEGARIITAGAELSNRDERPRVLGSTACRLAAASMWDLGDLVILGMDSSRLIEGEDIEAVPVVEI
jgi:hypothetical protein